MMEHLVHGGWVSSCFEFEFRYPLIALYIPGTDILYVLHCACVGRLSVQVFLGPGNVTLPKLRN